MVMLLVKATRGSANPDTNSSRDPGVKPIRPVWRCRRAERLRVVRVARLRSVKARCHWLLALPNRGKAS